MTSTINLTYEVDPGQCDDCPHRGIDGGPGPVMVCDHPGADSMGYIISWNPERTTRQSDRCPLTVKKPRTEKTWVDVKVYPRGPSLEGRWSEHEAILTARADAEWLYDQMVCDRRYDVDDVCLMLKLWAKERNG